MAITESYGRDGVSITNSEYSVVNGSTTPATSTTSGIYQFIVDPAVAMVKGDEFTARIMEKVELTGGTQRQACQRKLCNAIDRAVEFPPLMLMHGHDQRIVRNSANSRNFDLSVRRLGNCAELYEQDGLSVSGTELSLTGGTSSLQSITTAGVFQLWLDLNAMAKGDEFRARCYEKVDTSAGTKRVLWEATFYDVQSEIFFSEFTTLYAGWEMTIIKLAGTDRAIDASIRYAS